ALSKTIQTIEKNFAPHLKYTEWLNLGGGHLFTGKDYNLDHLVDTLETFQRRHSHLKLLLEPGSAIAWQTGVLQSTVLDIIEKKDFAIALLDISFAAHMPDCLEMPYTPKILSGSTKPVNGYYKYKFGGLTCLAGDQVGEYYLDKRLKTGDKVVFLDMMHYTMVKTTTFNGVDLPSIAIQKKDGSFEVVREPSFEDYSERL
ncbi:carboxynorspermidine decarboxylase, partial [bacterium J17]